MATKSPRPNARPRRQKADNDIEEAEKETSKPAAKGGSTGAYNSDDDVPDAVYQGQGAENT